MSGRRPSSAQRGEAPRATLELTIDFERRPAILADRSIPRSTVVPELAYPDVGQAGDWLTSAFGFTLRIRIAKHRAQMTVGDGAIIVTEAARPEDAAAANVIADRLHSVMVRVDDVDAHYRRR